MSIRDRDERESNSKQNDSVNAELEKVMLLDEELVREIEDLSPRDQAKCFYRGFRELGPKASILQAENHRLELTILGFKNMKAEIESAGIKQVLNQSMRLPESSDEEED